MIHSTTVILHKSPSLIQKMAVTANCEYPTETVLLKTTFQIFKRTADYEICNKFPLKSVEMLEMDHRKCDFKFKNNTVYIEKCLENTNYTSTVVVSDDILNNANIKVLHLTGDCGEGNIKNEIKVGELMTLGGCSNKTMPVMQVYAKSDQDNVVPCAFKTKKDLIKITKCTPTADVNTMSFQWLILINLFLL